MGRHGRRVSANCTRALWLLLRGAAVNFPLVAPLLLPVRWGAPFPTPYTIQRRSWNPDAEDAHGNETGAHSNPVAVLVHGWAPPSPDREPAEAGREATARELDVYAPAGTQAAPKDEWIVDGVPYESVGYAEDFTHGPWQWAAGVRISLRRVEG